MSTPLLPAVIPEIGANPVSFFLEGRGGVGHRLELHSPSCIITITWGLGSMQNTENEANVHGASVGHQNLKYFQLQEGFAP